MRTRGTGVGPAARGAALLRRHVMRPRDRRTVLFRPDAHDYRIVGMFVGRVLIGVGALMALPAAVGVLAGELNEVAGFLIGGGLALTTGVVLSEVAATTREPGWSHGVVVSAIAWLIGPFFGAVPLLLSGHYGSALDAYFDAMSGFATAGLAVINDLDHVADSVNVWRHLMQYVGGQGLVLVVLTLFASRGGALTMYVGEARQDRIVPNAVGTARFIARVSVLWLLVATPLLWIALLLVGYGPARGLFHAVNLFMAAFSTGGYAPLSASVGFYHSALLEVLLGVVMVAGASSFALHHLLWRRGVREVARHLEVRAFVGCLLVFLALGLAGLARTGAYGGWEPLLRRGLFTLLSAQTTTGFATVPSRTLVAYWGTLAPAMVVAAMAIGAMSGSTGGGIKAIRIGAIAKSLRQDVVRILAPPDAVLVARYHAGGRRILDPEFVRSAATVSLLFLLVYGVGGLVGMFYGYPFDQAFFESVSAAGTVGLSVGLTGPTLETGLKVVYILQIWMGRLEIIAVLVLAGFAYSTVRGRP